VASNSSPFARAAVAAAALVVAAGCAPSVPRLGHPFRVEAFCGSKKARLTSIASIMTSTDDKLLDDRPTTAEVERNVSTGDGAIAYFDDQPLALPRVAGRLGESDGYVRVRAVGVPPAPDGATVRHVYFLVRDHTGRRWITMNAYDVQDVCVEGKAQA
jgi:hypothetical protein